MIFTPFEAAAVLVVIAAILGYVNYIWFRMPHTIGLTVMGAVASILMIALDKALPELAIGDAVRSFLHGIDFDEVLLDAMLSFLLFAGALHIDLDTLLKRRWAVLTMALFGVVISTFVVGLGFKLLMMMLGLDVPMVWCLVFGALISPTDPVAVLGILKSARVPPELEAKIGGESLFNDGVGYVVFLLLVGLAFPVAGAHTDASIAGVATFFAKEALGGALLGAVLGWCVFQVMKRIDDYPLEILLSLGLAFGGYELAVALHVSGPIMAVVAGLFIGNTGVKYGMSKETRQHLNVFWTLIDEMLNAVLFLLIGVEIFAITFNWDTMTTGLAAIALALVGRLVAVAVPIAVLSPFRDYSKGVVPIMTWGGLKGGISVALALSLPASEWKAEILTATYLVVLFSIIVQGLTVASLARRVGREPEML